MKAKGVKRTCVWCGAEIEVFEARDSKTGKLVPVPRSVVCGHCVKKARERKWQA